MHRRPAPPARLGVPSPGWRRPAAALATAAVGVGGAALLLTAPTTGVPVAQLSAAPLAGADGAAIFAEANLTPGRSVTRCVVIDHHGTAGSVRLAADDISGDLAPYLSFTIAVGTGGSRASCAGFAGGVAYTGPLTGLAGGHAATAGVPTGWQPAAAGESRTYRITVTVADDNAAQGKTTAATLRWLLVPSVGRTPKPTRPAGPASPSPAPGASSSPPWSAPGPSLSVPGSAAPGSASSGPAAPGSVAPGSAAPGAAAPGSAPSVAPGTVGGRSRGWPRVRKMLAVALKIAAQAARHATIPLLAILLALLFLTVQDRIDRRDPKLMLAPLSRDRYLTPGDHSEADLTHDDDR